MAIISLKEPAKEEGTYVVRLSLIKENSIPAQDEDVTLITWSLSSEKGIIINNRQDVALTPLTAIFDINLVGPDLALIPEDEIKYKDPRRPYVFRVLNVHAEYTGSIGAGQPINEEVWFRIEDLLLT